jgi:hypothetical protein
MNLNTTIQRIGLQNMSCLCRDESSTLGLHCSSLYYLFKFISAKDHHSKWRQRRSSPRRGRCGRWRPGRMRSHGRGLLRCRTCTVDTSSGTTGRCTALTRRGSSSVIMYINIHYNTANIPASRSVSCNVGIITAKNMQKIVVQDLFALFLNTYKTDCPRMYWYMLVSTSMYYHDIFIIWFILVQTCLYLYIPLCLSVYYLCHFIVRYVLVHTGMYWYKQVHASHCQL